MLEIQDTSKSTCAANRNHLLTRRKKCLYLLEGWKSESLNQKLHNQKQVYATCLRKKKTFHNKNRTRRFRLIMLRCLTLKFNIYLKAVETHPTPVVNSDVLTHQAPWS